MGYKIPGYELGRTMTPREIAWGGTPLEYLAGGATFDSTASIDGGNGVYTYEIRAGWLLGRNSTTNLITPCKRTTMRGTGSESSSKAGSYSDFDVVNAAAFAVGDVITVSNASGSVSNANLTITAVNYTLNRIYVNAHVPTGANYLVFAQNGTQTCIGVSNEFAKLRNWDNSAAENKTIGQLCIGGVLNQTYLLGDVAAIVADTTSANNLRGRIKIYNPSTLTWTL